MLLALFLVREATLVPALGLIAVAPARFTLAPVDEDYVTHVLPVTVLLGIGGGLAFPALMMLAMSDVQPSEAGLASGLVNTTAQVGGALGLAVLATLASTRRATSPLRASRRRPRSPAATTSRSRSARC